MKKKLHYLSLQILLISFCELLFVSLIGIVSRIGNVSADNTFPWYLPFSLILIALLTALPGLLLYDLESSARWKLRILCHFLVLGAIVMSAGYFFRWYSNAAGAAVIFIVFCTIYALVWSVIYRSYQRDDARINEKLQQNRRDLHDQV